MIEVRLVGDTQVHHGPAVVTGRGFGGVKPRHLLEVLAVAMGTSVSKDRLAHLLWQGRPPASWSSTLEGYVSVLRGRLEPGVPAGASVIRTVNGGYRLDRAGAKVDNATVRALVSQARLAPAAIALPLLRRALELADGDLLASSFGVTWADEARQEHRQLRVEAASAAARHALRLGQAETAAAFAVAALALDPLAEQACRLAMRALWASGRTAEALRRHADLRAVLSDELGVDPSPRTQAVLLQLLRDEVPSALPRQRRSTDHPLLAAGRPEGPYDRLAGDLVVALRRADATTGGAEDPELVAKLRDVLRHLQRGAAPDPSGTVGS